MNLPVPFIPNTSDGIHCFEASFKMVLGYFEPEKEYSWADIEKITGKVMGKWTWPTSAMLWFIKNGYELVDIEILDYKRFAELGAGYLTEFFGKTVGEEQIQHSDLTQERKLAQEFASLNLIELRLPTISDIERYLTEGFLVVCNINSSMLNGKPGYVGHAVVVKGFNEKSLIIHDPGLPPAENRSVEKNLFIKAWAYPDEMAKNVIAIRKNS